MACIVVDYNDMADVDTRRSNCCLNLAAMPGTWSFRNAEFYHNGELGAYNSREYWRGQVNFTEKAARILHENLMGKWYLGAVSTFRVRIMIENEREIVLDEYNSI